MAAVEVDSRKAIDCVMKHSKHFLQSVSGEVRFLSSCWGNDHLEVQQNFAFANSPTTLLHIKHGLHRSHKKEKER